MAYVIVKMVFMRNNAMVHMNALVFKMKRKIYLFILLALPPITETLINYFEYVLFADTLSIGLIFLTFSSNIAIKFVENFQMLGFLSLLEISHPLNTRFYFEYFYYYNLDQLFPRISNNKKPLNPNNSTTNNTRILSLIENSGIDLASLYENEFFDNSYSLIFILLFVYFFIYVILILGKHLKRLQDLEKSLKWGFFIRAFELIFLQMIFFILIQISKLITRDDKGSLVSNILSISFLLFFFIIVINFAKNINSKEINSIYNAKYKSLWNGINPSFFFKKNYAIINMIRKFFLSAFFIFFEKNESKILAISSLLFVFCIYLTIEWPFISKYEMLFHLMTEFSIFSFYLIIYINIIIAENDYLIRYYIGFAIVGLNIFNVTAILLFNIFIVFRFLCKFMIILRDQNISLSKFVKNSEEIEPAFWIKFKSAINIYRTQIKSLRKETLIYSKDDEEKNEKTRTLNKKR